MPRSPDFPDVPVGDAEGWELVEESVETVFTLPTAKVLGATRHYEDRRIRAAIREATDGRVDHQWRFVSATRLAFSPRLPPGTMPASILPMIRRQARQSFTDRLEERGVSNVERRGRERMRVDSGARARLTRYAGTVAVEGSDLPVAGWVGAWYDRPDFFVVTGGYPAVSLADSLSLDGPPVLAQNPSEVRDAVLEAFRGVR